MITKKRKDELITVVVPIYNMGKYLERAVNSLLNQTYKKYEILLIDDGSTDCSGEKSEEYAKNNEKIKVYHKENGGLSSARNFGIEHANGKYIIFPDPDDWVSENYLETLISLVDETSDLEVCGHYVVTDKSMKPHSTIEKEYIYNRKEALESAMISSGFCGFAWNKLYHMEIIKRYNLRFDEELGMAQDLHFLVRYLMECNKIKYSTKPLYYYYQHIGGVTNAPLSSRKISGLKTYEKIAEIVKEDYLEIEKLARSTYANMSLQFMYIYFTNKMKDKILFYKLKSNFRKNISYFLKNKNYGIERKLLGVLAYISPKLSFKIREILR